MCVDLASSRWAALSLSLSTTTNQRGQDLIGAIAVSES